MNTFEVPQFLTPVSKYMDEYSAQRLSVRAKSGELVRVRRGLYLPAELWASYKPWEKYRVRIQAVHELACTPPVFARESAAQVMGLPFIGVPRDVQTVVAAGRSGGQSSAGVRRVNAIEGDPTPWKMFGLLLTPPPQTARDLAVQLPLTFALPAMDKLVRQEILPGSPNNTRLNFSQTHVLASAQLLPSKTQRIRVARVVQLADGLSQSPGESWSRALMFLHGFPRPELQQPIYDSRGRIGFPDFNWEEYKTVGEFDGIEKYSAQKYLKGMTPSDVVVAEKKREDRFRARGYKVVRWVWDDLQDPRRLVRLLHEAGLPSKGPKSIGWEP